jgi:hypothetical protein
VLDNALGYVLNQEATAHFGPDNFKAYAFKLDYAVVTFPSGLDGADARRSSNTAVLLTPLFSGLFAGFIRRHDDARRLAQVAREELVGSERFESGREAVAAALFPANVRSLW